MKKVLAILGIVLVIIVVIFIEKDKLIKDKNEDNKISDVTENIKKRKYIYVKFNIMNGIKDINMSFIEFYNSQRAINKDVHYFPKKSIFDYWKIYKKRLPKKLYKYLDLLSKRYDFDKPEKVRKLALMVMDNISNSSYELSDGSIVHNTMFNIYITCYKITLKLI